MKRETEAAVLHVNDSRHDNRLCSEFLLNITLKGEAKRLFKKITVRDMFAFHGYHGRRHRVPRITGETVHRVHTCDTLKFDLGLAGELAGFTVDGHYQRNGTAIREFSPLAN